MTHLLHLDASARTRSLSRRLGAEFVQAWRAEAPDGEYTYRDLTGARPPQHGRRGGAAARPPTAPPRGAPRTRPPDGRAAP
ncbi:NAD(P)H-dependent oxidoreductase, partial [Nocardia sp. NPDC058497]|uniref:NAD(P)H-dependent oxidoreductase n=1 Tax=Nocardia sp. NPDC058497 TaxID=3346529 RepID=UPI00364E2AAC